MYSRWSDEEADQAAEAAQAHGLARELGHRIYASRLIGRDPDLVLHGGGNTSVKIGDPEAGGVIHVKGSGWDLGDIDAPGLPALRLAPLLEAQAVPTMSDKAMVAFLRANLLDPAAPTPSVETLLHAFLPHAVVDHVHATAILSLADQDGMEEEVARIFDGRLAFVRYVMPGYDLSHAGLRAYLADPSVEGLWLEKHGLFTFGASARESYERTVRFVTLAEEALAQRNASPEPPQPTDQAAPEFLVRLLTETLQEDGRLGPEPALDFRSTPAIRALVARPDVAEVVRRGTATPDHVIRLKPVPMILSPEADRREVQAALQDYAFDYLAYFDCHASAATEPKTMLDPLPRAVLVPGVGVFGLGRAAKDACIVGDLWEQTARIVLAAEAWGRFSPISERELFDMEYWSLEQAKLTKP